MHHDGLQIVAVNSGCTTRRVQLALPAQQYNRIIHAHCKSGIVGNLLQQLVVHEIPPTEMLTWARTKINVTPPHDGLRTMDPCNSLTITSMHTWHHAFLCSKPGLPVVDTDRKNGGTTRSAESNRSH